MLGPNNHISKFLDTDLTTYKRKLTTDDMYKKKYNCIKEKYMDRTEIFTDGSKSVHGTGFAVIFKSSSGQMSKILSHRGDKDCSPYEVELSALWLAVNATQTEDVMRNRGESRLVIYSDSLSSIQAIGNSENNEYLPSAIRERLRKDKTVICWVPGHVGIEGNEFADKMAKAASTSGDAVFIPPIPGLLIRKGLESLRKKFSIKVRMESDESQSIRNYLKINPSLLSQNYDKSLNREDQVILLRMRTGHSRLTNPLPVANTVSRRCPKCKFNGKLTSSHILLKCPESNRIYQELDIQKPPVEELLNPNPSNPIFFALINALCYRKEI